MKFWAGVTDNEWFSFLRREAPDEVNFWQPSGRAPFVQLSPGAPFLFKLKRPHHHVAGLGTFVRFTTLPLSLAWDVFERKNGAATRDAFEALIRPRLPDPKARDPEIGCTVLSTPQFWPESEWIATPSGWRGSIQVGRYYESSQVDGALLWEAVQARVFGDSVVAEPDVARYGNPILVKPRLGQCAFRVLVTDAYSRTCAITGEHTLPVLEAAHIRSFAAAGPHDVGNGLLLRSDFHKLFDVGLITVTPELRIEVSPRIREEWFNGKVYYRLHGERLSNVPERAEDRPRPEFLRWHNEERFDS